MLFFKGDEILKHLVCQTNFEIVALRIKLLEFESELRVESQNVLNNLDYKFKCLRAEVVSF